MLNGDEEGRFAALQSDSFKVLEALVQKEHITNLHPIWSA